MLLEVGRMHEGRGWDTGRVGKRGGVLGMRMQGHGGTRIRRQGHEGALGQGWVAQGITAGALGAQGMRAGVTGHKAWGQCDLRPVRVMDVYRCKASDLQRGLAFSYKTGGQ